MPIQAVIFDIDNTLLDWSKRQSSWFEDPDGHLLHLTQAAKTLNPQVSTDQIEASAQGFRKAQEMLMNQDLDEAPHLGKMLAQQFFDAGITPSYPDPEAVLQAYAWTRTPNVAPFEDVAQGLDTLQKAGYQLGIITNGYQPMSQRNRELANYDLLGYFGDCRFSSADVGVLKPDALIFETALKCLALSADQVAYVGDHLVMDVLGAQQAGMKGIWRLLPHHNPNAIGWIKPDATIKALTDLPPILKQWD